MPPKASYGVCPEQMTFGLAELFFILFYVYDINGIDPFFYVTVFFSTFICRYMHSEHLVFVMFSLTLMTTVLLLLLYYAVSLWRLGTSAWNKSPN